MSFVNKVIAKFPQVHDTVKNDISWTLGFDSETWDDYICELESNKIINLPLNTRAEIIVMILDNTVEADTKTCISLLAELRTLFNDLPSLMKFAGVYYSLKAYGAPIRFNCDNSEVSHISLCYSHNMSMESSIVIFGEFNADVILSIPQCKLEEKFGFFEPNDSFFRKLVARDYDGMNINTIPPFCTPRYTWDEVWYDRPAFGGDAHKISIRLRI